MKLNEQTKKDLVQAAKQASQQAYAPYSGFKVGAALLSTGGEVFTGCNVENASYSLTICAERNAVFQAVAAGVKEFAAIAIYVDSDQSFPPCGACRQVLAEFSDELSVLIANRKTISLTDLAALLPERFSLKND